MQMVAERFDQIDKQFAEVDRRFTQLVLQMNEAFVRLERRQDAFEDTVKHHAIDIRALQRKTASA